MHPACALCRGACCESIVLTDLPPGEPARYLALHGERLDGGALELPVPCSQHLKCGGCSIWPNRPQPCRDYAVGGLACRSTIIRRRPAQAVQILDLLPPLP